MENRASQKDRGDEIDKRHHPNQRGEDALFEKLGSGLARVGGNAQADEVAVFFAEQVAIDQNLHGQTDRWNEPSDQIKGQSDEVDGETENDEPKRIAERA